MVFVNGKKSVLKSAVREGFIEIELPGAIRLAMSGLSPAGAPAPINPSGVIQLNQGDSLRIVASGFLPGARYAILMFSQRIELSTGHNVDGSVNVTAKVPEGLTDGRHTLQVNGANVYNSVVSISTPVDVVVEGSSAFGRAILVALVCALLVAAALPAGLGRRRRR